MDASTRRAAALTLTEAAQTCRPIPPLTVTYPDIDVQDAYSIQFLNVDMAVKSGAAVRGHKVGLTSSAMQQMAGAKEPDYGHLLNTMFLSEGEAIRADSYIQPRVVIGMAFVLGHPLAGGGITVGDVLRATEFVLPSIELIDSRIADWKVRLEDTVADNGSAAGVVLGGRATRTCV
jgi:2-keto-4-pentenoate hydratase